MDDTVLSVPLRWMHFKRMLAATIMGNFQHPSLSKWQIATGPMEIVLNGTILSFLDDVRITMILQVSKR